MKYWLITCVAFAMFAVACEDKPGAELAEPDVAAEKEEPKAKEEPKEAPKAEAAKEEPKEAPKAEKAKEKAKAQ